MSDFQLYLGDCLEVMRGMADNSVDAVVTDPPYSAQTHDGMRSMLADGHARSTIDFAPMSAETLRAALAECGRVSRRWVVAFMDWQHAAKMHECPPDGLDFVRLGIWVKRNGMRQLSCDRPGMGWESIAFLHKSGERKRWNGRGRHSVFDYLTVRAGRFTANFHPTEKPVGLVQELITLFTNDGDTVLDPFMGSGTTGVACAQTGRNFIGVEIDPTYFAIAEKRIAAARAAVQLPMMEAAQ